MLHSPKPGPMMPSEEESVLRSHNRRRSSSRSSSSSVSPSPLNSYGRRSSSVTQSHLESGSDFNDINTHSSSGAIPLTKNVGVSVNFGKSNLKSNSTSVGSQHIIPDGQQHTPGASPTSSVSNNGRSSNSNSNDNGGGSDNGNIINLGHGHIGTVGSMISSGVGSSSAGVNHNSSLSTSPAVNAPTTCANKGVPSSQSNQEQHLSILSPQQHQQHSTQMSSHSPNLPMNYAMPEPGIVVEEDCKNSDSSSSSRNGSMSMNTSRNNKSTNSGPISPTSSISSSSSAGTKADTQSNDGTTSATKATGSNGSDGGSAKSNTNTNRIVSQNVNGTYAVTGVPKNESELQLFRVFQRANLLSYYDKLIDMGGDDVQQLCEAGEEEFLEIMALIGMAAKPLHVRRLQKALQEWMTQPSLFQAPVLPPGHPSSLDPQLQQAIPYLTPFPPFAEIPALLPGAIGHPTPTPTPTPPIIDCSPSNINTPLQNQNPSSGLGERAVTPHLPIPTMLSHVSRSSNNLSQQNRYNHHLHSSGQHTSQKNNNSSAAITGIEKGPFPVSLSDVKIPADQLIPSHFLETRIRTRSEASSPASSLPGSPHPESRNSVSPVPHALQEHEIQKLAESAIRMIRSLPPSVAEPKFSTKRKTSGDYELILRLSETDPRRMDEVRRVAAVYGRADAKRKSYKPLSMHELAINEAAAQLCKHVPALLTKRDELLSLSRQLLRESGLPYAAVSSTFSISILTNNLLSNNNSSSSSGSIKNPNNNNNNDINTKSKYDEIYGTNRLPSSSKNDNSSSTFPNGNYNIFGGFHGKRFRLDGSSAGIEIQEYGSGRPISAHGNSPSPPTSNNGMLITELRNLPSKRPPSDQEDHYLPTPLELVTVTSSDLRKSGGCYENSKASPGSSSSIMKPTSVELSDLNGTHHPHPHHHRQALGTRVNPNQTLSNISSSSSVKVTSIPVSGGSISIMNHNGIANLNPAITSANHLFSQHFSHHHHHHNHHQYNGHSHNGIKILPIKSEPTVN